MEEASNASTPVTMVAMISYFVAIFAVINDPDGPVATVATFLPPSAPFVVPLRAAFDAISPVEMLISIVHDRDRRSGCCSRSARGSMPGRCSRRPAG